jgi:predicted nucleic acid-binding protein
MLKLFIDSSVLVSACISAKGAAREIIRLAIRHQVEIVTSLYAFDETEINLNQKSARSLTAYRYIKSRAF